MLSNAFRKAGTSIRTMRRLVGWAAATASTAARADGTSSTPSTRFRRTANPTSVTWALVGKAARAATRPATARTAPSTAAS